MIRVFSGNAHPAFCHAVHNVLSKRSCVPADIDVGQFVDGETKVQIRCSVRGDDCYVVQPTCAPTNHNLMELLIIVDALKRASAGSITAVVSYFGYARQERKAQPRTPISASLVARLLESAGVNRVVTVDLHAAPIQGFFMVPVDNLYAKRVLALDLATRYQGCVVVSPDAGGFERARQMSKCIPGSTTAVLDKRREHANLSEILHVDETL